MGEAVRRHEPGMGICGWHGGVAEGQIAGRAGIQSHMAHRSSFKVGVAG